MSNTVDAIENSLTKTYEILNSIQADLWLDNKAQAYSALRVVLHAVRDRLPVTVAANLAAQFPIIIRWVYYEERKPESAPAKMDINEFIKYIENHTSRSIEINWKKIFQTVTLNLFAYLDPNTYLKIQWYLPNDYRELFETT